MKKTLKLLLLFLFFPFNSLAENELGPIVQRQAMQIIELKSKINDLEKSLSELKQDLASSGVMLKKSQGASDDSINSIAGEGAANAISNPEDTNSFFEHKEKIDTSQDGEKAQYDTALAALKDSKFEEAEKLFDEFIKKYPSSNLQSNATFWYGETFYRRNLYNKAAINYLHSYKQYPKGSKAADSLLKLAYALSALNKRKEACSMLEKLDTEFPDRPIASAKRSREAKEKFQCLAR